jgi:hypothetical protein
MRNFILIGSFCLAAACGGTNSVGNTGGASAATGTWTGMWLSHTGVGGSATLELSQTGSSGLSGTISFTDSPCFSSGAVTATVTGDMFLATVTAGGIEVTIDGTLTGGQISGTYDAISAGACTGDTGTFSASQ